MIEKSGDLLDAELRRANYPIRDVETLSDSGEQVELAATLVPTTASEAELDSVVAALERSPLSARRLGLSRRRPDEQARYPAQT